MSQYHKKFLRKMLAVSDPLTGETFIPKAKRNQSELIKHALFINTWNTQIYYQTDNAWSWIWTSSLEPTISYINEGSKMKLVSLQSVTHTHTHTHMNKKTAVWTMELRRIASQTKPSHCKVTERKSKQKIGQLLVLSSCFDAVGPEVQMVQN